MVFQLWQAVVCVIVLIEVSQLINASVGPVEEGIGYTKEEQLAWATPDNQCGGHFQSPVAISSDVAVPLIMPSLKFVGYDIPLPGSILVTNNGHSASVNIVADSMKEGEQMPTISGGLFNGEYALDSFHFHWGHNNSIGSEHSINHKRFPIEMHIVHRNLQYSTLDEAGRHSDGIVVLALFYHIADSESPALENLINSLASIPDENQHVEIEDTFPMDSLFHGINTENFYTYRGSLTTPPCSEAVRWVLFPDTVPVTAPQMEFFRSLTTGLFGHEHLLLDNHRFLQPLGKRYLYIRENIDPITTKIINNMQNINWEMFFEEFFEESCE